MSRTTEERVVTIIGGGIIGCCVAFELIKRGAKVTIIDRGGEDANCSEGNAGVICARRCLPLSLPGQWRSYSSWLLDPNGPVTIRAAHLPSMIPWLWRFIRAGQHNRVSRIADALCALNANAVELYRDLLAEIGVADLLRSSNYVYLYRKANDANIETYGWRLRREHGETLTVLHGRQIQEAEPAVSTCYASAVAVAEQARILNPARLLKSLREWILSNGGQLDTVDVTRLAGRTNDGWLLQTTRGERRTSEIVVAAGAWSQRLLEPLGVKVFLEAERGYHVAFADPRVRLNNAIYDADLLVAMNEMETGIRCTGMADFAAIETAADPRKPQILSALAAQILPGLNVHNATRWMGRRPSTPDSLPYIGRIPGLKDITLAFGHGHLGLTGAPRTGRTVAQLICGEDTEIDLAPYRVDSDRLRLGEGSATRYV